MMTTELKLDSYISLRPDIEIQNTQLQEAKVFLQGGYVAEIELDTQSRPVFEAVLSLLEGNHTIDSIINHLEQKGFAQEDVLSHLDFLLKSGFIFQFANAKDKIQAAGYGWRIPNPQAILARLAEVQVHLFGESVFYQYLSQGLKDGGVNLLFFSKDADSQTQDWQTHIQDTDLIIVFNQPWEQVLAVNFWAVEHKKPLLVGWWEKFTVTFYPLFMQGVTACPSCLKERLTYPHQITKIQAGSLPMVAAAANFMAGLAVDFLSGATFTSALSSIHEINLRQAQFLTYPALKNPRCHVCSRLNHSPEGAVIHG